MYIKYLYTLVFLYIICLRLVILKFFNSCDISNNFTICFHKFIDELDKYVKVVKNECMYVYFFIILSINSYLNVHCAFGCNDYVSNFNDVMIRCTPHL